jgi:hypothetical protein
VNCSIYGFGIEHDILFNSKKCMCLVSGARKYSGIIENMYVGNHEIQWVNEFKYLGPNFIAKKNLEVIVTPITRKFYAALNSVFAALASEERGNVIARVCMSVRMSVCVSPKCATNINSPRRCGTMVGV